MSTIKITLSRGDLETLLLTENGEIKLEIGQQIADAFAAKYLKSIIHDELTQKIRKTAEVVAIEQWKELVVQPYCTPTKALTDLIQSEIKKRLEEYVNETIQNGVEKAKIVLAKKFSPEKLVESIEARVTSNVDKEIEKGVRDAIERALKAAKKNDGQ